MAHYSEAHYGGLDSNNKTLHKTVDLGGEGARNAPRGVYDRFLKRLFDIVAVMLVVPFVLPLVLVLGILVARDGGPVLYTQDRLGRGGRVFRFWKLRSMVTDADRRLDEYLAANPAARAEWDETQKLKNDPRITPVGRFMRKTSLDELPQLWNVLRGDMSLVGPRPMMPQQQALYPAPAYHRMRPGLTGFWQISDRNETSFASRSDYDAEYAQRLSFPTDILVLLMTVRAVLRGTGY